MVDEHQLLGPALAEVNPLPFAVVRRVVEDELLGGLPLEEVGPGAWPWRGINQ